MKFPTLSLAVLATPLLTLVLIPTLYAGLYLYANSDPYANLDQVPAAVVMVDRADALSVPALS